MEIKKIVSEKPKCKTCNNLMSSWNPFAEEHEHVECIAERVSEKLMSIIREQIKQYL